MANLKNTSINDTGFLQLPSGTIAERPSNPLAGMIRYNSEENAVEFYDGLEWILFLEIFFEGGLEYYWHDSTSVYNSNSHPLSKSEFDVFFDTSQSPLQQSGDYFGEINWGDGGQNGAGGTVGPKPSYLPSALYAWKVEGFIRPDETGTYTFGVDSDDASDVFVDGNLVAHYYDGHGFSGNWTGDSLRLAGTINLVAGTYYPFVARVEEGGGGDGIQVGWQKPGESSINIIPSSFFFKFKG